jgi:hypothetical protein
LRQINLHPNWNFGRNGVAIAVEHKVFDNIVALPVGFGELQRFECILAGLCALALFDRNVR